MGWNNGLERKRFEARQRKQAEEYRKLGMTEEQIQTMYEFDLEQYRSNRRYYMHTQPIPSSNFEDDENEDDSKSALYKDFIAMYTTDINEIESASWWMEELDDSRLIKVMNMLTPREKEVVSLMVQDEMSMQEVGDLLGINKSNVCRALQRIAKKVEKIQTEVQNS